MPNYVTHKISFHAQHLPRVLKAIGHGSNFDFNKLLPAPLSVYHAPAGKDEDADFKEHTWYQWNIANWGTKWNCCDFSIISMTADHMAAIVFDTAWSVPYPIIIAFANTLQIEFELSFFDEGHNFWGVEKWNGSARTMRRHDAPEDKQGLCIDLKMYDPEAEDTEV